MKRKTLHDEQHNEDYYYESERGNIWHEVWPEDEESDKGGKEDIMVSMREKIVEIINSEEINDGNYATVEGKCRNCKGSGYEKSETVWNCTKCHGRGTITRPAEWGDILQAIVCMIQNINNSLAASEQWKKVSESELDWKTKYIMLETRLLELSVFCLTTKSGGRLKVKE